VKNKIIQELIKEANSLKGMLAEVACKSRLIANQIRSGASPEVEESILQMQTELYKYSNRIDQIFEELRSYGIAPKLE